MFAMPIAAVQKKLSDALARLHNYDEATRKAEMEAEIEATWDQVMGKAERYVQGANILARGGHFSTMSLGNWMTLAEACGVEVVPTRLAAVINPIMVMDIANNGFKDQWADELNAFVSAIQDIADDEILRFDPAGNGAMKGAMAAGIAAPADGSFCLSGLSDAARGWRRSDAGTAFPIFQDERLVAQLLENPEDRQPVWIRKLVQPVLLPGVVRDGALAPVRDEAGADIAADFPCEWRVYVEGGRVVAVGNYYPQIRRGETPEDRNAALAMVAEAVRATDAILEALRTAGEAADPTGAIPHHPRYEMRPGFDPDGVHFTLDFIEVVDERADFGRRLLLLEGGPAHLRNPNWGAHPTSFGFQAKPEGLALGLGAIEPLTVLDRPEA